jgi:hypothetical protein
MSVLNGLTRFIAAGWWFPLILLGLLYAVMAGSVPMQVKLFESFYSLSDTVHFLAGTAPEVEIQKLEKRNFTIRKQLDLKIPRDPYLVVNTTENTFALMRQTDTLRAGKCSTGSYTELTGQNDQKWIFKTPKGLFRIQGKITSPVWRKPDWAFIEEGLPVPPKDSHLRYESGVLGDYALAFGNGYFIHGTLYQRFIGLPVTHGCVRMLDDDLKDVYQKLNGGSRVIVY